jgi:spore germination cell wall hydrolase CwlJ-like protein
MTRPLAHRVGAHAQRLSAAIILAAGSIACSAVPLQTVTAPAIAPAPVETVRSAVVPDFDLAVLDVAQDAVAELAEAPPMAPQTEYWTADDVALPKGGLSREASCLATAIYFEARGEPLKGQKAVAEVVMTRAGSGRYPGSICGVVYQNSHQHLACQFTFTCDGKADRPRDMAAWNLSKRIAVAALTKARNKRPITKWATHYHATYVNPRWASKLRKTTRIGTHIFYRES